MALSDQLGTVDEGGTLATEIFDALEAAKDAAGTGADADPTAANKKLADLLSDAIYNFAITSKVDTVVEISGNTDIDWDGSAVTPASAATSPSSGAATGVGQGEWTGTGTGGPTSSEPTGTGLS